MEVQSMSPVITKEVLEQYRAKLMEEEKSTATIEKYMHDVKEFAAFLGDENISHEKVTTWKATLLEEGFAPQTVNGKLSALNGLFRLLGKEECRARFLKIQRKVFRNANRELSRDEYKKLISTAKAHGNEKLWLVMETICATGIRVSELRYLTLEATQAGEAIITLKGKTRVILLPEKLCRKLQSYAQRRGITSGQLFLSSKGRPLSRWQIWSGMKALCYEAGIEPSKVFPHNLRHLFAAEHYRKYRNIVELADLLGHSNIATTRIYLISTGKEHRRRLEGLRLIS